MSELDTFFYPKSVAVVGASSDPSKIGGYIFSKLKEVSGLEVFPINVKGGFVQGVEARENVRALGRSVDLCVIAIPGAFVLDAVRDCADNGCRHLVIISAGFKEVGEEGKKREEELKALITERNLKVIGPNCLGILNAETGLNSSFARDIPDFGGIALISQSGAVIDAIIDWSFKQRIGFSKVVSLGNMAGVTELELLQYLAQDPKTSSIVFYMETLSQGEEFSSVLREVSKKKPVVIIKPGRSENAKKAIGSHTGSLAQDGVLAETLISSSNGILVKDLSELFSVLVALKLKRRPKKKSLVLLTNAGGPGVIATDLAEQSSFELYGFNETEKGLLSFLPKEASLNNPIDMLGDARSDRYSKTLQMLSRNENIGAILVLLTPQIMTDALEIAKSIVEIAKDAKPAIAACFLGQKQISSALEYFDEAHFPSFQTPHEALKALDYLYKYETFEYDDGECDFSVDAERIESVRKKLEGKEGLLDYDLTREVLGALGIEMMEKYVLHRSEDMFALSLDPNSSYVLKVDSKEIIHKKDVGGIVGGVRKRDFEDKVVEFFERMKSVSSDFSVTVEREVEGVEVIIGLKQDESLGHFVMFGLGGTFVSLFKDVSFALAPLCEKDALRLVSSTKASTLLNGYRGSKPCNTKALFDVLVRISHLQGIFEEIKEVDLNPVIVDEHGAYLVDVKLLVKH
ncbi:acetate--CoA ligase family protein [Candidatus Woesearchaeota archaeon]|nr:acetate--CoA ligase family protein [Nanoarchaeota archaeon]MCB9370918.1 acetate--CoA ligase family protein [Candidatus Woesearchaeota archaeon]USN44019.1 MAG: acetate--CoA ligase family protein [Candidatus Woesearchaeota archaeon]